MARFPQTPPTMSPDDGRNWTRSAGVHYSRKSKYEEAITSFNKFMTLKPDAFHAADVVYRRCLAKRAITDIKSALEDAFLATSLNKQSPLKLISVMDTLHELNAFEQCAVAIYDNLCTSSGSIRLNFQYVLDVLNRHFDDTLGDSYFMFMLHNRQMALDAWQSRIEILKIDMRPIWKMRKEKEQCDVQSLMEKQVLLLSPLEIAHRTRALVRYNQHYLQKSWRDVLLLRRIHKHSGLQFQQLRHSTPRLMHILDRSKNIVNSFMGMLHARNPLYSIHHRISSKNHRSTLYKNVALNVIQYQTNRAVHNALRIIRQYVKENDMNRLTNYIENIMGDYVVLKTQRIFPWRFEFINEVYNHLAIALINQYTYPQNIENFEQKKRLRILYNIPVEKPLSRKEFKFGEKASSYEDDKAKFKQLTYKHLISRLEKRLVFAKHCIERAYIYYTISSNHLEWRHYDKCCSVARKGIKEARNCNSSAWELLNNMLILKSQISRHKLEMIMEMIPEILILASNLKNINMYCFLEQTQRLATAMLFTRRSLINNSLILKRSKRSFLQASSFIRPLSASLHLASISSLNDDNPNRSKILLRNVVTYTEDSQI